MHLLGRDGKQQRAIAEFSQVPTENELYASIEELLADYLANLESRRELTQEDEELIMQLSEAYLKKWQEWFEEGKKAGREAEKEAEKQRVLRSVAINLLHQGMSPEFIMEVTGLSIDQIENLRQETELP